jgi:RHS repeat-associated protein
LSIVEEHNYYPFGLKHNGYNGGSNGQRHHKYMFGGKELQDEIVGSNSFEVYDFGARNYDASLGRWMNVDPLAEAQYEYSLYSFTFNNPIMFNDPTGMIGESTHTDKDGNVIAVYDDGDLGVYKHQGGAAEAKKSLDANYSSENTSAGGEKKGESLHSLSFADQNLYNKTGKVEYADIRIDFNSNELTEKVESITSQDPSVVKYASKAGTNGDWDIKSRTKNGSLLYGRYASPRDAGNFAAGVVAEKSGIGSLVQFGYGAYNLTGNSKVKTGLLTGAVGGLIVANPIIGVGAAYLIGKYGEDKLTQRSIDIGKSHVKK